MVTLAIRKAQAPAPKVDTDEVIVLAVGDVFSLTTRILADRTGEKTAFADFSEVTPELVDTMSPEIVVSSVVGRNFDCVDLAEKLSSIAFDGCYRLIAHGLPQPDLVLREMRGLFPDLNIELDLPLI